MASLCAFLILPINFAAAEEVAEDIPETIVSPSDENEGNLDYLTLVDSFVTAERIPTSRFDTPANVTVITADEIAANHYKSLSDIYLHVPGVINSTLNGSDRRLVLVDGVRREFNVPMNMIERIEFVKGGGSALYGTDAVGGVINIITKKGTKNETTLDLAFGSWKSRMYELTNEGIVGKFNWFADGAFSKHDPVSIAGNGEPTDFDKVTDEDFGRFAVNFGYDFTDRESLGLFLSYNKNEFGKYWDNHNGSDKGNEVAVVYDFKKGTSAPGFLKYYNVHQENAYDEGLIGNNERLLYGGDHEQTIQNIQYQNGWEFGKHKVITGLEYYKIDRKSWYWDYAKRELKNSAYYLQDTISVTDKWTVIPGVRLDHNNAFGNKWSPKLAANYRATEKTKVFASWGNVYRAPSMEELYTSVINRGYNPFDTGDDLYRRIRYIYTGNISLNPESGHTETIGVEHNFDDNTNIRASFFNTKLKDCITLVYDIEYSDNGYWWYDDVRGYPNGTYDNGESENRGFEFDFQKKVGDHFQYDLGYVFLNNKFTSNHSGSYGYALPKNNIYLGLHYANGSFKANLYGLSGSGVADKIWDAYKKSYFILDANLSYDMADWATVYVLLKNMTNKDYSVGAATSPGRSVIGGLQFRF